MKIRLWIGLATFVLAAANILQGAGPDAQWLGVLWTKGPVSVGDTKVSSGTTVLPGDVITTASGASAWVRFRSPASTVLMSDTQVTLLASNSTANLSLQRGTVVVNDQVADPVRVAVPGGFVLVKGAPGSAAECEMAAVAGGATVSVKQGSAEIHDSVGGPVVLYPGQSAHVEAGPEGTEPVAGKINRVIPQGVIQRVGQTQELPLQLNQAVDWNDLVRTLEAGRAQIGLVDGSTLNVGARSQIRILKHDPQAQQTEIEMTMGKIQANVQKITAPGGKFQLHTKSAVIGTIDTAFVAEITDAGTRICGVDGITLVGSSDPNIAKTVRLHKNECTFVPNGGAPTDPVLSPTEVAQLLNATNVPAASAGLLAGVSTNTLLLGVGIAAGAAALITGIVLATGGTTSPTTP
jgi:ferric-dicitrate binding protein FerR (iron transport regulator)